MASASLASVCGFPTITGNWIELFVPKSSFETKAAAVRMRPIYLMAKAIN